MDWGLKIYCPWECEDQDATAVAINEDTKKVLWWCWPQCSHGSGTRPFSISISEVTLSVPVAPS